MSVWPIFIFKIRDLFHKINVDYVATTRLVVLDLGSTSSSNLEMVDGFDNFGWQTHWCRSWRSIFCPSIGPIGTEFGNQGSRTNINQ